LPSLKKEFRRRSEFRIQKSEHRIGEKFGHPEPDIEELL
jgi:hypothetical protein